MSEYQFGQGPGHLPKAANEIASRHGAEVVNYTEPRGHKRHWITCENRGEPFDGETARAVMADLVRAGICDADSVPMAMVIQRRKEERAERVREALRRAPIGSDGYRNDLPLVNGRPQTAREAFLRGLPDDIRGAVRRELGWGR